MKSRMRRAGRIAVIMLALTLAAPAQAAPPDFLLRIPEDQIPGEGAAELDHPRGIAADPDSGHIYVADRRNARVSEYTAWGLFVKSWGWGVATGASELQTCGPLEPQGNPPPDLCRKGLPGIGEGQMALLRGGIEVDGAGNVWVGDLENLRIQKFNPAGQFLLMLGGKVNQTKVTEGAPSSQQNVCPVDPGDVCQVGSSGTGASHLSNSSFGDYIAYSPFSNAIMLGDQGRIQVFNLDGGFREEIPFAGELASFAGESVNALDIDEGGGIYLSLDNQEDIYKLSPSGEPLAPGKPGESKFDVIDPRAVAIDAENNVYAIDEKPTPAIVPEVSVPKFNPSGEQHLPTSLEEEQGEFFPYVPFQGPILTSLATNLCADGVAPDSEPPGNLYLAFFRDPTVSHVDAYGSPPIGCEPPPINPPEIVEQFATAVGREEATLKARINPRFWDDTTYYVEYGTGECSAGGCDQKAPLDPRLLTDKAINNSVTTAGVVLGGLEPETSYRYRFVAESSGGGPIHGEDPDGLDEPEEASFGLGIERTFRTFAAEQVAPCPNDPFRRGAAARLPDCRAYEMVSPLDKGNADAALWLGRNALAPLLFELHQSAPSGNRFGYTSWTSFGDSGGAGFTSQYLTDRKPIGDPNSGWLSRGVSPPRTASPVSAVLGDEFQGFSEDLCQGWLRHASEAPLAKGAIPKYSNLYERENCAEPPNYLALTTAAPEGTPAEKYFQLRVQGASQGGTHLIFTADGKLAPDAPMLGEAQLLLYEHGPDGLRFICYLPNGNPVEQPCGAGTASGTGGGNTSSVHNAISADGERIFWSAYSGGTGIGEAPGAPGRIYARIGGNETRRISQAVAVDPAWFWMASDNGSKAIVAFDDAGSPAPPHANELYEVDVDTETPGLIAEDVEGPLGASEDASRIYFASTEDLDGAGEGAAGERNLYFYEAAQEGGEPTYTFVMELAAADIGGYFDDPAPIDEIPAQRWARVSADGLHATFVSATSPTPTGYDNRDAGSGEPAREVYHYDAEEDRLLCISCNPSGARPTAANLRGSTDPIWTAARIQGWEIRHHAPRVLSEDGTRVFFESYEALEPEDTNGVWDVYQWEEAGKGTCKATSASYSEDAQGCIDLISSGESPRDSTFLDADPSGDNVFFGTLSSLIGADYGLNDVYDARVGGGFPEPVKRPGCQGEACQSPPPPPPDVTPASEAFEGPEDEKATKRCPRGKRKVKRGGQVRCVKAKKGKRKAKRHSASRRVGR